MAHHLTLAGGSAEPCGLAALAVLVVMEAALAHAHHRLLAGLHVVMAHHLALAGGGRKPCGLAALSVLVVMEASLAHAHHRLLLGSDRHLNGTHGAGSLQLTLRSTLSTHALCRLALLGRYDMAHRHGAGACLAGCRMSLSARLRVIQCRREALHGLDGFRAFKLDNAGTVGTRLGGRLRHVQQNLHGLVDVGLLRILRDALLGKRRHGCDCSGQDFSKHESDWLVFQGS